MCVWKVSISRFEGDFIFKYFFLLCAKRTGKWGMLSPRFPVYLWFTIMRETVCDFLGTVGNDMQLGLAFPAPLPAVHRLYHTYPAG